MAKLRITYNAPVILTFTLAAVFVFVMTSAVPHLRSWFVAYPRLGDAHAYVGLFGHILAHESWEHLLGNFTLILLIGPILGERRGSVTLLLKLCFALDSTVSLGNYPQIFDNDGKNSVRRYTSAIDFPEIAEAQRASKELFEFSKRRGRPNRIVIVFWPLCCVIG